MADRIWVEHFNGNKDLILFEGGDDEMPDFVINISQAKQLVLYLNKLIAGEVPEEEAEVEGVED